MRGETIGKLLRVAEETLRERGKEPARLEAEVLLAHVLGRRREWLMAHDEEKPAAEDCSRFLDLLEKRSAGNPLQYLTHRQEFWSLAFYVDSRTLVPRPESELARAAATARRRYTWPVAMVSRLGGDWLGEEWEKQSRILVDVGLISEDLRLAT